MGAGGAGTMPGQSRQFCGSRRAGHGLLPLGSAQPAQRLGQHVCAGKPRRHGHRRVRARALGAAARRLEEYGHDGRDGDHLRGAAA
eukprot:scaffold1256_cov75-Phaeocystis_antarctica.AAC.1